MATGTLKNDDESSTGISNSDDVSSLAKFSTECFYNIYDKGNTRTASSDLNYLENDGICDEDVSGNLAMAKSASTHAVISLKHWQDYKQLIAKNKKDEGEKIEKRRREMMNAINKIADDLMRQLDDDSTRRELKADETIENMQTMYDSLDDMCKNTTEIGGNCHQIMCDMYNDKLTEYDAELSSQKLPEFSTLQENLPQIFSEAFGCVKDSTNCQQSLSLQQSFSVNNSKIPNDPHKSQTLMKTPQLKSSFKSKTVLDEKEPVIADMVLTENYEIAVVDKSNNRVKLFDLKGKFISYVCKNELKEPIRVSTVPGHNVLLITDNQPRTLKFYNRTTGITSLFATDQKYPLAHCTTPSGNIAILESSTKYIFMYHSDGTRLTSFNTHLDCPVYLCCTAHGNFVVSDSKNCAISFFTDKGVKIRSVTGKDGPIDQPYGVAADSLGHVLVADRKNHTVHVIDEYGGFKISLDQNNAQKDKVASSEFSYIPQLGTQANRMKFPVAVVCDDQGLLVTCQEQGQVKVFQYLDASLKSDVVQMLKPVKRKNKKSRASVAPHKDSADAVSDAETAL